MGRVHSYLSIIFSINASQFKFPISDFSISEDRETLFSARSIVYERSFSERGDSFRKRSPMIDIRNSVPAFFFSEPREKSVSRQSDGEINFLEKSRFFFLRINE